MDLDRGHMMRTMSKLAPNLQAFDGLQQDAISCSISELTCVRPTYTQRFFDGIGFSNLEASGSEEDTFPPGHRGRYALKRRFRGLF
ncbi:hypothetical protein AVEN_248789-1 [Araneus ventricosus]|uniref:Uncharacterized protein n=1 Tax=Araneus ventricosus TaxID=182803 RepID=A0A4Y2PS32_ARAVE|nr:hypothetical protein AVEN_248789-1 [Araneus ventricosus]